MLSVEAGEASDTIFQVFSMPKWKSNQVY